MKRITVMKNRVHLCERSRNVENHFHTKKTEFHTLSAWAQKILRAMKL